MTDPVGFVDLHAHLFVGLDDGPRRIEDALALCRQMVETGTTLVAATCHQRGHFASVHRTEITEKFGELKIRLEAENIPLRIVPNAEWMLDSATIENLPHLLPDLVTMGDAGRYALVEFPRPFPSFAALVPEMLSPHGLKPILAHVERYDIVAHNPNRVEELIQRGYVIQVNAESITNTYFPATIETCRRLIQRGLVHVIASDSHSVDRRPTRMKEAQAIVSHWTSSDTAQLLMTENPLAIIEGRGVRRAQSLGWLTRLRRR